MTKVEASLPLLVKGGSRNNWTNEIKLNKMKTTHNGQGGGKPTIIGQRGLEIRNTWLLIILATQEIKNAYKEWNE